LSYRTLFRLNLIWRNRESKGSPSHNSLQLVVVRYKIDPSQPSRFSNSIFDLVKSFDIETLSFMSEQHKAIITTCSNMFPLGFPCPRMKNLGLRDLRNRAMLGIYSQIDLVWGGCACTWPAVPQLFYLALKFSELVLFFKFVRFHRQKESLYTKSSSRSHLKLWF
jgi:hypothetical protein